MTETFPEEPIIWTPSAELAQSSEMARYMRWLASERGLAFPDYDALWEWSTTELEGFWTSLIDFWDLPFATRETRVIDREVMPGARWFEGATLNWADQVWRHVETNGRDAPALRWRSERGEGTVTWGELADRAASLAQTLRGWGVAPGDRVCAILPNGPESVIACLATASIGATWSLCSPDMGATAILGRFAQITPRVLIAADGYAHGGRETPRLDLAQEVAAGLPGLARRLLVPVIDAPGPDGWESWADATAGTQGPPRTEIVPFDHPLWIVYSSGTTGTPKPIVHGHGGILLEGSKFPLHNDIRDGDTFLWLTASGWIMWNCQVIALTRGVTVAIFDGAPNLPDMAELWRFAARAGCTFVGAGAAFFSTSMKAGVSPKAEADLGRLRAIGSTGSPLAPEAYDWIQANVADVWITPIAGGTDFAGAFVGGCILLPVRRGEMQCRFLGARVEAWDEHGRPVENQVGELVCTRPMPSMPLYFWGDADGSRYAESYFETWPNVWKHGDWIRITPTGGAVIYGRSDATINRRGLRLGTSEIYRAVEELDEILDSLVVDLEYLGRDSFMPLFVVLREGVAFDEALKDKLRAAIRASVGPRYLPDEIVQIPEVPRTLSGKKLEVPVKKLLLGVDGAKAVNRDSMANPRAFDAFEAYAAARAAPA
ncbi:acetoacetate--CoA ligase [Albimonas pacifica]|uniref:Acetoacetyl-CoA synthetase n=1 Tax=Albimonas pacifica TaxID=1114924 RepID=A0A1I3KAK5_9RHOB|nr:acetoacetate--CoA ligase [Albimonas pacifica]SFI69497.1 acetoacetyl-CoA synthetase [Albimonas pacifica]